MGQGRLIRPWPFETFLRVRLSVDYLQGAATTGVHTGTLIVVW